MRLFLHFPVMHAEMRASPACCGSHPMLSAPCPRNGEIIAVSCCRPAVFRIRGPYITSPTNSRHDLAGITARARYFSSACSLPPLAPLLCEGDSIAVVPIFKVPERWQLESILRPLGSQISGNNPNPDLDVSTLVLVPLAYKLCLLSPYPLLAF